MPQKTDSAEYQQRKRFFDSLLTVYGRKPVLEALQDNSIDVYRLHLAESNRRGGIVDEMVKLAEQRGVEIVHHSRQELARISRNGKQDQGVAADLQCHNYLHYQQFLKQRDDKPFTLIALDGITNPQNLGMIIRSVCASQCDGLLLPSKGTAELSPLVIKASAGTLFRCPILRCDKLSDALREMQKSGTEVCTLSSHSKVTLNDFEPAGSVIYVLGNETEGVSDKIIKQSDVAVKIPMNNGVESLNVAVTAALVAFKS